VDEKTLEQIATMTGGEYFRATNNRALKEIYAQIDSMEKTRIEVRAYRSYTELFYTWAGLGLLMLLVEFTVRGTVLRKLP
jgi:Ca-activated chloride channel family protein